MAKVLFQSLTRKNDIGSNSYLLEIDKTRILLDSGMHPKLEGLASLPDFSPIKDIVVDAAIITHAHLDHVGALPIFQRQHPEAEVIMTETTAALADAMLHNSVNVMTLKRDQENVKEYPLFTHSEIDRIRKKWALRRLEKPFEIGPDFIRATFHDAGHLLGAVGVDFRHDGQRIFYTGDVHFECQTLMTAAIFPDDPVDTLIMETTRGAATRRPDYTRRSEALRLAQAITETVERGGSVLMPVFAMGKTQEMLLLLHQLRKSGDIPRTVPVVIGGLSTKMTQLTDRFADNSHRQEPGLKLLELTGILTSGSRKGGSQDINYAPGRIYALSSGMMSENTRSNDFAFQFLDNPKNALLFVGYADPDTPAGRILATKPGDPVTLHRSHPAMPLKCRVEHYDFSGHAPREQLVDYAKKVQPKKILLVHGDRPALTWFDETLRREIPGAEVIIPVPGEVVDLS